MSTMVQLGEIKILCCTYKSVGVLLLISNNNCQNDKRLNFKIQTLKSVTQRHCFSCLLFEKSSYITASGMFTYQMGLPLQMTKYKYWTQHDFFTDSMKNTQSFQIIWDNSANFETAEKDLSRSNQVRIPNRFFIYPGTKWCGAGNIAENENDFGEFRDADKCCRNHDFCPDVIEGHQTKHNLTNPSFFTRLNCACDEEFHKCLKSVNSHVSSQIGHIYFTALGTQCYRKDYPIVECKKYTYIPRKKCKAYELDESQEKVYEWFDVPNY